MPKMVVRDACKPDEKPIKWFLEQGKDCVLLKFEGIDGSIWSALVIGNTGRARRYPCISTTCGMPTDSAGRIIVES